MSQQVRDAACFKYLGLDGKRTVLPPADVAGGEVDGHQGRGAVRGAAEHENGGVEARRGQPAARGDEGQRSTVPALEASAQVEDLHRVKRWDSGSLSFVAA